MAPPVAGDGYLTHTSGRPSWKGGKGYLGVAADRGTGLNNGLQLWENQANLETETQGLN